MGADQRHLRRRRLARLRGSLRGFGLRTTPNEPRNQEGVDQQQHRNGQAERTREGIPEVERCRGGIHVLLQLGHRPFGLGKQLRCAVGRLGHRGLGFFEIELGDKNLGPYLRYPVAGLSPLDVGEEDREE